MFFDKCSSCGRFIGYDNHVSSAPYGRVGDIDPLDIEFLCLTCWDESGEQYRLLHYNTSYIKPLIRRSGREERYAPNV